MRTKNKKMAYKKDLSQLKKDREKTTSKNNNPKTFNFLFIKDWEKMSETRWEKPDGTTLLIIHAKEYGKKDGWVIQAQETPEGWFGNPYGKTFKTKSQALKYAKEYMRRN